MNKLLFLLLWLIFPALAHSQPAAKTAAHYLSYQAGRPAFVSAHRGGRFLPGYPENALETFALVAPQIDGVIECDVNMTADSVLVLMHDYSLDRTTTGTGKVADKEWGYLSGLHLVDDFGEPTSFRIPRLEEALLWCKGRAVLMLDIKRGVPFEKVATAVKKAGAENFVAIITYNPDAAKKVHRLDPQLIISVGIRNEEELAAYLNSGIDTGRLVAFTGVYERSPAFYTALHEQGISCIIGTMGNIDNKAKARGMEVYHRLYEKGADIFATDYPLQVQQAIDSYLPVKTKRP